MSDDLARLRQTAAQLPLEPVDPRSPVAVTAVEAYFAEMTRRFGYDAAGQSDKDAAYLVPPDGVFVVAVSDGSPVACGGVQTIGRTDEGSIGEVKRMWVHDDWRGAGLGSRLLRRLEEESRRLGHAVVRLDTNEHLGEAIAMYERAGYAPIERYNDNPQATHFFEKRL